MLEPNSRQRLFELLRPPAGFVLDRALGTTFTLDLPTLVTIPLAMLRFDWQSRDGQLTADPIALLEGLRQCSDRLLIFCQQDRIRVPKEQSRLFAFLESAVIPVKIGHGVFHPKIWVLRFAGSGDSVHYRLLCLTRNLTPDRSWDTVLSLEGELKNRSNAIAANHRLGDFIQSLSDARRTRLSKAAQAQVNLLQEEIRRVEFALPEGFEEYGFWFSENGNKAMPFRRDYQRMFVLSPFLEPELLERITDVGEDHVLVSRLESLDAMEPKILKRFKQIYYLNPLAELEDSETNSAVPAGDVELSGLHAKLYIAEERWEAHFYSGSANATNAAFYSNVEFLTRLTGKKSRVGIDILLAVLRGRELVVEYKPGRGIPIADSEEKAIEDMLNRARAEIAGGAWQAQVIESYPNGTFRVQLCSMHDWSVPDNLRIFCAPITQNTRTPVTSHPAILNFTMSLEALTSFFAFTVNLVGNNKRYGIEFALNVPLLDLPQDRMSQLLYKILQDRTNVLRLLMLMLADDQELEEFLTPPGNDASDAQGAIWQVGHDGVFEALVRALDRHPEKLERVAHLIEDLNRSDQGRQLLPEGIEQIWQPIQEAMRSR